MFNINIHFVAHVSYSLSESKKYFITCRLPQCYRDFFFSTVQWIVGYFARNHREMMLSLQDQKIIINKNITS